MVSGTSVPSWLVTLTSVVAIVDGLSYGPSGCSRVSDIRFVTGS